MTDTIISAYMKNIGSKGGNATAKTLTAKQRSEIASKAAKVRWGKKRKKKG